MSTQQLLAVIYTRVSTHEQAEHGTSLTHQLEACRRKAAEIGATIVAEYQDAGVSGAHMTTRPGIQATMEDIREGRANVLIVLNSSRLVRNIGDLYSIVQRFKAKRARLVFCEQNYDDSPSGKLAMMLTGVIDDYNKEATKIASAAGRRVRAQSGKQPMRARSPWGYHIVTKADVMEHTHSLDQLGTYQVVEDQAKWAAQIFPWLAQGTSLNNVCRILQDYGVPTPGGGRMWTPSTLLKIYRNPVYKGFPEFGKTRCDHDEDRREKGLSTTRVLTVTSAEQRVVLTAPALVDEATWEACQRVLDSNQATRSGDPTYKTMLGGILKCPECGHNMRSQRRVVKQKRADDRVRHYYHCRYDCKSHALGSGHVCNPKKYNAREIEGLVLDTLAKFLGRPTLIKNLIVSTRKDNGSDATAREIKQVEAQLRDLREEERATAVAHIQAVRAGGDTGVYEGLLHDAGRKRARLEGDLAALREHLREIGPAAPIGDVDMAVVKREMEGLQARVLALKAPTVTDGERFAVLSQIVRAVVWDKADSQPAADRYIHVPEHGQNPHQSSIYHDRQV